MGRGVTPEVEFPVGAEVGGFDKDLTNICLWPGRIQAGINYVLVAGSCTAALRDAMLRMDVNIIGPPDSAVLEI